MHAGLRSLSGILMVALAFAGWAPALVAGEFTIAPLRVALDRGNRAAEITIRNDDSTPLRMQLQAMAWRQDAAGRDQYEPADGLIYFPRALEIAPRDSRIVRVGIKAAPVTQEETYRLFIEELPPPGPAAAPPPRGATVRVALRVGVPVFVAPAQPERKGEITHLEMKAGRVQLNVSNAGNVHFAVERVELTAFARDGTRLHTQTIPERYFLAGVTKALRWDVPADLCRSIAALEASVAGDKIDLKRKLDVAPGSCN